MFGHWPPSAQKTTPAGASIPASEDGAAFSKMLP
jgi:hypothetical protein